MEQPRANQVSEELLQSFLASVNTLRDSVAALHAENDGLRAELRSVKTDLGLVTSDLVKLQRNSGMRFPQFRKLPSEIRRMVWCSALSAPQIHILSDSQVSRSRLNDVVNSCREARNEAEATKLDWFVFAKNGSSEGSGKRGYVKNYTNVYIDIYWADWDNYWCFPEGIYWFCAKCVSGKKRCGKKGCVHSAPSQGGPARCGTLAVNYSIWDYAIKHQSESYLTYAVQLLATNQVPELLFVVGDVEATKIERNVVFVTPSERPFRTQGMPEVDVSGLNSSEIVWADKEKEVEQFFQRIVDERADARQALMADEGFTSEELDEDSSDLMDLSHWIFPKIKFVEVKKEGNQWVLPPPGTEG